MSEQENIRWVQRFSNYNKALDKLINAITYAKENADETEEDVLEDLIKQGVIQGFEYTHELAWNVMKDYARYQGNNNIGGSRDAVREAVQLNLIEDGGIWMEMITSRNKTSHTYNEEVADTIFKNILSTYQDAFLKFQQVMEDKKNNLM